MVLVGTYCKSEWGFVKFIYLFRTRETLILFGDEQSGPIKSESAPAEIGWRNIPIVQFAYKP